MKAALRSATMAALPGVPVAWGEIPQGTGGVRVRLWTVGGPDDVSLDGRGMSRRRVQVDVFGDTYLAASAAADAVSAALSGYRSAADQIHGVFLDAERDLSDTQAGEVLHRISQDYSVSFTA